MGSTNCHEPRLGDQELVYDVYIERDTSTNFALCCQLSSRQINASIFQLDHPYALARSSGNWLDVLRRRGHALRPTRVVLNLVPFAHLWSLSATAQRNRSAE